VKNRVFPRVIPIHLSINNLWHAPTNPALIQVSTPPAIAIRRKIRRLTQVLLCIWCLASFAWVPFARDLDFRLGNWTFNFWMAAQGSVLLFLLLTVVNAWLVNRWEKELAELTASDSVSGAK
jgi:putative solute:sodium symporter small subunit